MSDLVRSVLLVLVAYLLTAGLALIGVEIDPELFNTIVAAIVAVLLTLFGYEGVKGFVNSRRPGTLK